jgi:hypothetical protein
MCCAKLLSRILVSVSSRQDCLRATGFKRNPTYSTPRALLAECGGPFLLFASWSILPTIEWTRFFAELRPGVRRVLPVNEPSTLLAMGTPSKESIPD